jgi:hypothetical protein
MAGSIRTLAAALATALAAAGTAATAAEPGAKLFGDTAVTHADYFIGTWGMGSAEECYDSDTIAFYANGAWAVTNGGGNPVEAIGTWSFADGKLTVHFTDLEEPEGSETVTAAVEEAGPDRFTVSLEGSPETLYRCT